MPCSHPHAALLEAFRAFIVNERDVAAAQRLASWNRSLSDKRRSRLVQQFRGLRPGPEPGTAWGKLVNNVSHFREGDYLCLHTGSPLRDMLAREVVLKELIIIGPDMPPAFATDDDQLNRDIALYCDLVASCARMSR
jgi:hypothetical protein